MLFILILCYSPLFYANAQTIITSLNQTGYSADECLINGGEFTGASISGNIIIANGLDIPNVAFAINRDITSVIAAGNIGTIGMEAFYKSSAIFTFNDVRFIGAAAFWESSGTFTFNDVGTINGEAFWESSGDIIFNDVGTIKKDAFRESSSDITFNDVGTIEEGAFRESSGDITFNNVETIKKWAFFLCKSQIYVSHQMTDAKIEEFYTPGGYQRKVKRLRPIAGL